MYKVSDNNVGSPCKTVWVHNQCNIDSHKSPYMILDLSVGFPTRSDKRLAAQTGVSIGCTDWCFDFRL